MAEKGVEEQVLAMERLPSYLEGATMRERNTQIGGHKAE